MNIDFGAGREPKETQKSCVSWYDYGFRFYDPQLARFVCLDPIADKFAHVSPYNYAENRPIDGIDLWGLQYVSYRELLQNGQRMGLYTEQEVNQFAGAHEKGTIKGSMLVIATFLGIISTPDSPQKSTTPENDPTPENPKPSDMAPEGGYEKSGRGKNKMAPSDEAEGSHSTFKKDSKGNTDGYETYKENKENPTGYDTEKRFDGKGKGHYDKKTGEVVETPHVHEKGIVRKPEDWEIPKTN